MIKIAHECPIDIFDKVEQLTDYSYALVHLFEENDRYLECFQRAKLAGREIILDNSIFELGVAFDADKFKYWVNKLQPTWYIIPDVLEDAEKTVANARSWNQTDCQSKSIGVVQGKSYDELKWCYQEIEPLVDKVALSFDYGFFVDEDLYGKLPTKYHYYMHGRDATIHRLIADGVINEKKPHHLLGCGLPQEFSSYTSLPWIDSLDTSNPVVAGLSGLRYNGCNGLEDKPSQKLYTLIENSTSQKQLDDIVYNINSFRGIVNGF